MIDIDAEEKNLNNDLNDIEYSLSHKIGGSIDRKYRDEVTGMIVKFQNDLEYIFSQIDRLRNPKTNAFIDRVEESLNGILALINEDDKYIHCLMTRVDNDIQGGLYNSDEINRCLKIIENIKRPYLIKFFADLKLANRIVSLAIEDKIKIRAKLQDFGFNKTLDALDEAEENLISKSPKDAADRCRESLEQAVKDILEKIGVTPTVHFRENTKNLVANNVINQPTKTDCDGFYTYLAQMGVHSMEDEDSLEISSKYLLEDTYRKIMKLIEISEKKLDKFKK